MGTTALIAALVLGAGQKASPLLPASEFKAAFNGASDHVRLLIMLAPS